MRTGIESVMVGQRIIDEEIRAQRLSSFRRRRGLTERDSLTALVKVKDRQLRLQPEAVKKGSSSSLDELSLICDPKSG